MRLVDVDAVDDIIQTLNENGWHITRDEYKRIDRILFEIPTVDAVEVMRCKDCKHNYHIVFPSGEEEHICMKCFELPITADFYCAWGEREDGVKHG